MKNAITSAALGLTIAGLITVSAFQGAFAAEVGRDTDVALSHEHTECKWVSRRGAAGLVQWPAHISMMQLVQDFVLHKRSMPQRIPK